MQTIFNIFAGERYTMMGALLLVIVVAHLLIAFWRKHKFSSESQQAIDRLRSLERRQPSEVARSLTEIAVDRTDNLYLLSEREQTTDQKLVLHDPSAANVANRDVPRQSLQKQPLPLEVGTRIQAARNIGPIKRGSLGIITGMTDHSFCGWSRPRYVCTFAENKKIQARPRHIAAYEHGYNIEELEQPDFASSLSRQIALRAQELFKHRACSQRPA